MDKVVVELTGRDGALALDAEPAGALGDLGGIVTGVVVVAGADVADAGDLHPGGLGHLTLDEERDLDSLERKSSVGNKRGVDISARGDGHGRNIDLLDLDQVVLGSAVGEGEGDGVKSLNGLGGLGETGKEVREEELSAADAGKKGKSNESLHVKNTQNKKI